jgi:hypothetical protein
MQQVSETAAQQVSEDGVLGIDFLKALILLMKLVTSDGNMPGSVHQLVQTKSLASIVLPG